MEFARALSHTHVSPGCLVIRRVSNAAALLRHPAARPAARRALRPAAVAEIAPAPSPLREAAPAAADATIVDVASREDFQQLLAANKDRLVVLMCKAKGCHPCKAFRSKYAALGRHYSGGVFAEVMGDRNESTRALMKAMKVKATPTFAVFVGGEQVHMHSGVKAEKLIEALAAHSPAGSPGNGADPAALEAELADA